MKVIMLLVILCVTLMALTGCADDEPDFPYIYYPHYACAELVMGSPARC